MQEYSTTEITAVRAGIGGGFTHTSELKPMKYEETMAKDLIRWTEGVNKEHQRMVDHKVYKTIKIEDIHNNAKLLILTWTRNRRLMV